MKDKMREDFEKYCRSQYGWDEERFEMHAGQYLNGKTFHDFELWQASRAALVVDLPDPAVSHSSISTLYTEDVCNALENAGISYE